MRFKKTTIPPEGRNKYGNYISADNVTKTVINTSYYGNSTGGNDDANKPNDDNKEQEDSFLLFLSKTAGAYDGRVLAATNVNETIDLIGYKNLKRCDTYVGDISGEDEVLKSNYGIIGLPTEGMTVTVSDNGTPNTKINFTITSAITNDNGTLKIPCNVYRKSVVDQPLGDDADSWVSLNNDCTTLWLSYDWSVFRPATESYTLDLSNEIAAINCDKDGNIYADAVRPTCTASMYYGSEKLTGVTFSITTDEDRNVVGLTIDTETGVLTFGSNFSFSGSTLEIAVKGTINGAVIVKVMTVTKQYAGQDGTPALTRWVVPSANVIRYNPNESSNNVVPSKITCKVMMQVGEDAPVEDTSTTIYYGWDTTDPTTEYTGEIEIDVSKTYLVFALKNENGDIYESETIQILKDGLNNTTTGESVYRLILSNENASINADKDGNIYENAYKPTCTATLYYGSTKLEDVAYSVTTNPTDATGVSIDATTGVITLGDTFNFTGTSLEITVSAKIDDLLYGTAIMSISKSIAGADGDNGVSIVWKGEFASHPENPENGWAYKNTTDKKSYVYQDGTWYQMTIDGVDGADAVSYWLDLSTTEVVVAKGTTTANPSSITLKAYKQVGGDSPTDITSTSVIKWGYNTASPSSTSTTISSIDTGKTYIMVHLVVDNVIYDRQTISILKDGVDGVGIQGRKGAAIRGPVDWKNVTTKRLWCDGKGAEDTENGDFIDVVVYNGTYYICTATTESKGSETSAPSSTYWKATDKQYEFVSTNLLLADNAKIKFSTNNELYLTDNSGNVTAGAAGGNGTSFWAGANEPTNAKFKVNYDGTMTATKGSFGVLSIGTDEDGFPNLAAELNDDVNGQWSTLELNPHYLYLATNNANRGLGYIKMAPNLATENLGEAMDSHALDVFVPSHDLIAISSHGKISASDYEIWNDNYSRTMIKSPFANMDIAFICDSDKFVNSNNNWTWNGGQLAFRLAANVYPYIKQIGGQWCFCKTSNAQQGIGSGIYTSSHTKQPNKLYIVV